MYHCFYLHLKIRNEVEHLLMFSHFYLISVNLKSVLSTLLKILAVLDYFIVYFLLLSLTYSWSCNMIHVDSLFIEFQNVRAGKTPEITQ